MKITKVERTGRTLIVKSDDKNVKYITSSTAESALKMYNEIIAQITTVGFYELK
jgi:pyruvate/2-oxoglutarate/acetoin dehydrogenase E1 component